MFFFAQHLQKVRITSMLSLSFNIVSSYHPNGRFNWSALSKLQAVGIEVLTALAA